jgi:hypothetical protein
LFEENTPAWHSWREAALQDGVFASQYARDSIPDRVSEDWAETMSLFVALQGTKELESLRKLMPNRAKIIDRVMPTFMAQAQGQSSFTVG